MPKGDVTYHSSAVRYNQEIAQFAEDLAPTIEDEEVQKWSRAVAKQHRFHEGRHKKALRKAEANQQNVDSELDPGPVMDDIDPVGTNVDMLEDDTKSIQDAQAEFAQSQEKSDVETEADLDARIEAIHGPGAVEALEAAYADGSIFGEKDGTEAVLETGIIDPDSVMGGAVTDFVTEVEEDRLCGGGFNVSMPTVNADGKCNEQCRGGHPVLTPEGE